MDETGVLGLLEELSILLEDSKPVFGKSNLRQVDIAAAFEIMDEIRDTFPSEFAQARQIVRERQSLLDDAEALLAEAWPDRCRIKPNYAAREAILAAFEV